MEVSWPAKPIDHDLLYQVILKYSPDQPYIVGSPESPATSARFDVSDEVRAKKLYYTVKYWRKDGAFQGATQYGQSGYKVLEVVK